MTRINASIPPKLLTNKHLLAEHREIKRIPNVVASKGYDPSTIPSEFRMGKGHVKFFYNKQKYLLNRYVELHRECLCRGFNVQNYTQAFLQHLNTQHWGDTQDTAEMTQLVAQRINTRLGLCTALGVRNWHELIDK
jgi:deoxyribonuclease (pyrimidine dimer)